MPRNIRERDIEQFLVREAARLGGIAYKWAAPGQRGVPDRIVILPKWVRPVFVELKAPGAKPTRLQRLVHDKLSGLGHFVHVLDSFDSVSKFLSRDDL